MNKPDWKDAPEWASWLAMETSGGWFWVQSKPTFRNGFLYDWDRAMSASKSEPDPSATMQTILEPRP